MSAQPATALAADAASTITALRIANEITGGTMPSSDPLFAQMLTKVVAGDNLGAASIAANSNYFATYLARRLALQMQNPALDASVSIDNDATAFLVAHMVGGGGTAPSISTMWSDNSTYLVNVTTGSTVTQTHAASLTPAQLAAVNWQTDLVRNPGQTAKTATTVKGTTTFAPIALPVKHVGGYITLSDRPADTSFAQYGATAGTNLRMIEGIWEIATGLSLVDAEATNATAANAPRFVPEYNPNFTHGIGQAACIACHGGGMSSLTHGYATVADVFDFNPATGGGLVYIPTPTVALQKSLGSDPATRTVNSTCNLTANPTAVCNPDSSLVDPNNGYDLSSWGQTGLLAQMGWKAAPTGQGLNQLGIGIGQSQIAYEFMTKRVIGEVCPMGAFTAAQVTQIANAANPFATPKGTDDVRTIVALVASNASCL